MNKDMSKLKATINLVGYLVKEGSTGVSVLFAEDAPDFNDPGRLRPFATDQTWGGCDMDAWFRVNVRIPPEWDGREIRLGIDNGSGGEWDLYPQCLAFVNGREVLGVDVNHNEVIVSESATAGEDYYVDFEAWSGFKYKKSEARFPFKVCVYAINRKLEKLYYDMRVPFEVAMLLDGNEDALKIYSGLREAANMLDLREPGSDAFNASADVCQKYMESEFYGRICDPKVAKATAWCIGHTHIDVAWLWTYSHTMRKTERSFATVLGLMERYPEYIFMSSQPQLYQYVKQRRPDMYGRIKDMISMGRWEAEGGMWVEADCNLASGEALIRQFVHGKRFFREEYGVDNRILWLPDVFGYSANLPQICKKCGIDYFMTTKLSWNDTNMIPYDSFIWKGVDGTGILTHFVPAREYVGNKKYAGMNTMIVALNSNMTPSEVMGGWERYQQKDIGNDYMIMYGYGDGGGGTTNEMVENLRRMGRGIPGCPVTIPAKSLDFFKHLEETAGANSRLPEWNGELYLENHRGTYTSVAKNKRFNRKSEQVLQALEALSVMAGLIDPGFACPAEVLDRHWKTLLLNQFHDVLPGSSVKEVYEDTDIMYEELLADVEKQTQACKAHIAASVGRTGDALVVFNTLGFTRNGYCIVPDGYEEGGILYDGQGNQIVTQRTHDNKLVFLASNVPGMGMKAYTLGCKMISDSAAKTGDIIKTGDNSIETSLLKIVFDEKGRICSLYDKECDRELIKPGKLMNVLETYEDRDNAWEIAIAPYCTEKRYEVDRLIERRVVENGPVRAVIALKYSCLASEIRQNVIVYGDSKRIDFETEVDWNNEHVTLKVAFSADILADKATFEIQYGAIERPTHYNTSWDHARFETCAQKWADLSEDGYGVSLMNNCKYGYDVHGDTLRLTLLRSPMWPCADADKGRHVFTYSIMPHAGGWREGGTVREAYDLNVPLTTVFTRDAHEEFTSVSLVDSCNANVNIEVLKAADNCDGVIIRAYEAHGRRGPVRIATGLPARSAFECDMLENNIGEAQFRDGFLSFDILPYEIKTFRLTN